MVTSGPFVFIDVETTGHDPLRRMGSSLALWHEIIDIGALIVDSCSFEVISTFSALVKPEYPERCLPGLINHYPRRAAAGEWDSAVSLAQMVDSFLRWCESAGKGNLVVPVGHNFFFDWNFLIVAFAWCGIQEDGWARCLHYTRVDTRSMAVQELWTPGTSYDPGAYSLRHNILAGVLGISPEPVPHRALNGARQSLAVFQKLAERKRGRIEIS